MKLFNKAALVLCFFLAVVVLTSGTAAAGTRPIADFDYRADNVSTYYEMHFYDTSSGYPTSWTWYFGDGCTSHAQNPSHIYDSPGWYWVALRVSNVYGSSFVIKEVSVTV
jgi:PKD repeat protein